MSGENDSCGAEGGRLSVHQGEMFPLDRRDGFFIVESGSLTLFKRNTNTED